MVRAVFSQWVVNLGLQLSIYSLLLVFALLLITPPHPWFLIFSPSLLIPPSFLVSNCVLEPGDSSVCFCLVGCFFFIFFSVLLSLSKHKSIILVSLYLFRIFFFCPVVTHISFFYPSLRPITQVSYQTEEKTSSGQRVYEYSKTSHRPPCKNRYHHLFFLLLLFRPPSK